jgi:predicted acyl esterase
MGATVSRAEPDLTHSVGGPVMYDGVGQLDNAEPEARPDFLTFTAEPLTEPLDVVGVPRVGLYVRGTAPDHRLLCRALRCHPSWRVTQPHRAARGRPALD